MKWKTPKHGDTRIITKFLFLPLELNNTVVWMERVKVVQVYYSFLPFRKWVSVRFLDKY